jgi:glycyl-tRNA synthetase
MSEPNLGGNIAVVKPTLPQVLRARYEDARFFYNNDLKKSLDTLRPSLAGITFETQLGTMLAKADRVSTLVASVGALVGTSAADLEVPPPSPVPTERE